ncbi:MAG: thioredoxin family protein [Candidatus Thermoplasmatota archaeon]|nr:thioredoxin family protein [Candidatus Thermoplasmatota archaeon]
MIYLGFFGHKHGMGGNAPPTNEWPNHVVVLDKGSFNDFIQKYPLSVVDFWNPQCGPCRAMAPRIRRLSGIYKGKVAFGRVNTNENQEIARQYKIVGVPHFGFFCYGKKISSMTGATSVGKVKDTIDDLLKKSKH